LEVTFTPYEVAGYAQGTRVVHIPMSKLKSVIRADPRVPAASFDCVAAKSRIDKAICSDAELAHLDREVSQKYLYARDAVTVPVAKANETPSEKLGREVAEGYRGKAIQWQRAWLARRDHDCAIGTVACLKASYQSHLNDRSP
ncbi:MAG TPA: lysozyme inhibitor LprI family protein, partial [Rhizomicrobium sp.]|nr:lysozyme inhibitor LprI family protein [Rhizomicrobium sp.]